MYIVALRIDGIFIRFNEISIIGSARGNASHPCRQPFVALFFSAPLASNRDCGCLCAQ